MSSISHRIFGVAGANGLSQAIQFGLVIYLARSLGPQEVGKVFIGLVAANVLLAVFDFGSSTYFTRELSKGSLTRQDFFNTFRGRFFIFAAFCTAIFFASAVIGNYLLGATFLVAATQYLFQGIQSVAKSEMNFTNLSLGLVGDRIFCASTLVLISLLSQMSAEAALLSWCVGQISGSLILYFRTLRGLEHNNKTSFMATMDFRKHLHLGLFSLANVVVTLDQVLLGQVSGARQTGLIGAVAKLFVPLSILSSSASLVLSNHSVRNSQTAIEAIKHTSKVWVAIASFAFLVGVGGWFVNPIVDVLFGPEFEESKQLIGILAVSASLIFVNQPLSSLLQYFEGEKYVSRLIWITATVYLVFLSLLLPNVQNDGAFTLAVMQVGLQLTILAFLIAGVLKSGKIHKASD
jgi:O-antigen/teichoic acid export membrane protein